MRGQTTGPGEITERGSTEERSQEPRGPRYLELQVTEQQLRTPRGATSEEAGEARVNQGSACQDGGQLGTGFRAHQADL